MTDFSRHRIFLNEALRLYSERDFSSLVGVAEQAVRSAQTESGSASKEFREALQLLAAGYHGIDHIVIARALYEWLVRTGDTGSTLTARCELAHCMLKEGDSQGLAMLYELLPELLEGSPLLLAEALNSIGNTLLESDHPSDALRLYGIVENVRRLAGDARKLSECLYNIGGCHHALAEDSKAIEYLTEALNGFRAEERDSLFFVSEASYRLAVSYHRLGDYLNATTAYRVVVRGGKLTRSDADMSPVIKLLRSAELRVPPDDLPVFTVPERLSTFAELTNGMDRSLASRYEDIVRRFMSRDYAGCAENALRFLFSCPRYDVIQLLICCLERIGCAALIPAVGSYAVWVSKGTPFQHVIRYIIGEIDHVSVSEKVVERVGPNVVKLAVALHLASVGEVAKSDEYLADISRRSPRSFEGFLSLVERHFLGVPPEQPTEAQREVIGKLVCMLARGQDRHSERERVNSLVAQEQYDAAAALQQELCDGLESDAAVDPLPYAAALNNLADILFRAGRYAESLPYYKRSFELVSRVPEAFEAGDAANNVGNVYLELGRAAEAVRWQETAIALHIKSYGNHPRVLLGFLDLALAYGIHDPSQQFSVYKRAIRCVEDGLGKRYPRLVSRTTHAVSFTLAHGDLESAFQAIRDAMLTWEGIDQQSHTPQALLAAGIAEGCEGNTARAKSFLELAVDRATGIRDAKIAAAALIELGEIEFRAGQWDEALSLATRAHEVVLSAGEDSLGIAVRTQLLSVRCFLKQGGDTSRALEMLAAVTEVQSAAQDATRIEARLLAAQTHLRRSDIPRAIRQLSSAASETANLSASDALIVLGSIAEMFKLCGADNEVAECLARAEQLIPSTEVVDPSALAAILSLRCLRSISAGEFERADEYCQRALGLLAKVSSPAPALRAQLLECLGLIAFLSRWDAAAAAEAYSLSLLELDKCSSDVDLHKARLRITLAKTLMHRGEMARASDAIRIAYEALERLVHSPHFLLADALGTAGKINMSIGAWQTAASQLTKAREMFIKLLGLGHKLVIMLEIDLSLLHAINGHWAEALKLASDVRNSYPHLDKQPALKCRRIESLASYALGDWQSAVEGLLETLYGQIAHYLRVARLSNSAQRIPMTNSVKTALDELLAVAWEAGAIEKPLLAGRIFLAAVRSRRLASELLSLQEAALRQRADDSKWSELRELRMVHARTALANPSGAVDEQSQHLLKALQDRIDRLEVECYATIPELFGSTDLDLITIESLSARLERDQALVAFATFPAISPTVLTQDLPGLEQTGSRYVAFVLRAPDPDGAPPVRIVRLVAGSEIEDAVQEFTRSLRAGGKASSPTGVQVCEQLLRPLLPELEGITSLFIVPDGCLYSLPVGTIPTTNGQVLADRFAITYLEAVRDLLRVHAPSSEATASVVMANPDYEHALPAGGPIRNAWATLRDLIPSPADEPVDPNSLSDHPSASVFNFSPLPAAGEEGAMVARMLGTIAITGADANKTRFTSLSSPRILHLATHGYYIPIRRAPGPIAEVLEMVSVPGEGTFAVRAVPKYVRQDGDLFHETRIGNPMLRSGLALAGANTWLAHRSLDLAADDGIVSSADISASNLSSTELVVLSACETGLGVVDDSEGVIGIRRAFVLAGTKSLICSLWKVPDTATTRLMEHLYSFLRDGTPPAQALHFAQNQMRTEGLAPLDWAGFIHVGQF